jgi:nucleoside-diphosphate-sugar epimerase
MVKHSGRFGMTSIKSSTSKVLISGATGFIGSHVTRKLVGEGFEVGIIKRGTSDTQRIEDLLDKVTSYDVDLRDTLGISKTVSHFSPDAIIHLATYYAIDHQPQEIPLMIDANILGTINLLDASRESTVKLFVNTSSCFVYKESKTKLKEDADLNPLNLYALTKIQGENACSFYAEKFGLKTITLRVFSPYGPADHERKLIPYAIKSLLKGEKPGMTTGRQRWDFVYVDDIVDAYLKVLSASNLPQNHEIFNIGTGNAVSIWEIVSRIKEITGVVAEPDWGAIPHRQNEVWFICADNDKAKNLLGWQPETQIMGDGLELTVEWYKTSDN